MRIEQQSAQTRIDDTFHEHVDGLAGAAEARFEHREADLHAEHQEGRYQGPCRIDGIHHIVPGQRWRRICSNSSRPEKIRDEVHHPKYQGNAYAFAEQ